MKVAVLFSSPNKNGLTAEAKNRFVCGLTQAGAEVLPISLNEKNLQHCIACGSGFGLCREAGRCVLKDDFEEVYKTLTEVDGIAFITAVYWHDVTEQMKAFLDRLRRCETAHNGYLSGKRCFLAACAGGTGLGATQCLVHLEETLQHMGMRACDRIPVIRFNKDYMLPALEAAGSLYARRLAEGFDMKY